MRCPDPGTWTAFYGGELPETETLRLAAHLEACERCRNEFDRLCTLGAGIRDAFDAAPRTPSIRPRPRRSPVRRTSPMRAPLAAAAAVTVAALLLILKPPPHETPIARAPALLQEEPSAPEPRPPLLQAPEPAPQTLPPPRFEPPKDIERAPDLPAPGPALPLPRPPPPAPLVPPPPRPTQVLAAVAVLERCDGDVQVDGGRGRQARTLFAGQGLSTSGPGSRAVVRFPDGTRMELGEKTQIAALADRAGAQGVGKWVDLARGSVMIEAARQAPERAMLIATPHGDARIVGTSFRLAVEPDATRLDVAEGRVRLSRSGTAIDVPGGHFALAGAGVELAARPLPGRIAEPVLRFGFEDGRLPKAFDTGSLERGPGRDGDRFCVAGPLVKISAAGQGLFPYAEDLVLSFDYWAEDSVRTLDLHMWSRTLQATVNATIWNAARERWTHLVVPLNDLVRTESGRTLRFKPGEAVPNLWIAPGQPGKIYLDNLEIIRLRPAPARKKEEKTR